MRGVGREGLVMAEPNSDGYLAGGPLLAQNDPKQPYERAGR
jgi:hypothetical protein